MLTKVTVLSENQFDLEIRNAMPTDSIIVEKIEGLGPPDVNLFMGDYARDGGTYGGRRALPRNVILTLGLNPNYADNETVDGLRLLLYKAFMDPYVASDGLILVLQDDTFADRYILGYTDKFDGDVFSDDTTVRIELQCPNPYILDSAMTELVASGPTFPFTYEGSAETGLIITAEMTTTSSIVTFDLNGTKMYLDYVFADNDVIKVNTIRGQRRIQVYGPQAVTNRELTSDVATLTVAAHGYAVGDMVTVKEIPTDTFFNGTFIITAVTTNTFSYALVHADVASTASSGLVYTEADSTDILYALGDESKWLELHSVSNTLKAYGATDATVVANLTNIDFRGQHWGV